MGSTGHKFSEWSKIIDLKQNLKFKSKYQKTSETQKNT